MSDVPVAIEISLTIDATSAAFWRGATNGELVLQRCVACQRLQHPPGPLCRHCHRSEFQYDAVPLTGQIYSMTQVFQTALPWYRDQTPYWVALVELDCDPRVRMLSLLRASTICGVGERVRVRFLDPGHGIKIPIFVPDGPPGLADGAEMGPPE